MSIFDIMNYPFLITHIAVVDGYNQDYHYTHPSSGVWVPSVAARTSINGHLSPVTEKELSFSKDTVRDSYGKDQVQESGARKLAVDVDIAINTGDRIENTEPDGTITTWYVIQEIATTNVLSLANINRKSFYISRSEP